METEKKRKYCILFVDKCARLRYNMHINEKEVHKMTAMYAKKYAYSGNCSTFAAAGTSMPNARILDTAIPAVSIFSVLIAGRLLACG